MISEKAFNALFCSGPTDVRVLQDELKFGTKLTDQDRQSLVAVINPVRRAERKRRQCARYLRHYRRVAESLS